MTAGLPLTAQPVDAITIVVADDHAVVRSGLCMLLESEAGMKVVAEAGDADEAVAQVLALHPTVVVLDLLMPGAPSLPAIATLRREAPTTGTVVLTMQDDPAFAREALQSGAYAYVLKDAADQELAHAVRAAARGQTYLSPRLGARIVAHLP